MHYLCSHKHWSIICSCFNADYFLVCKSIKTSTCANVLFTRWTLHMHTYSSIIPRWLLWQSKLNLIERLSDWLRSPNPVVYFTIPWERRRLQICRLQWGHSIVWVYSLLRYPLCVYDWEIIPDFGTIDHSCSVWEFEKHKTQPLCTDLH